MVIHIDAAKTCKKINSCSCRCSDGIIDLSPLDSKDPSKPKFDIYGEGGWSFVYNPCTSYKGPSSCNDNDVTVCQDNYVIYNKCGSMKSTQFTYEGDNVIMVSKNSIDNRISRIKLVCETSLTKPSMVFEKEAPTNTYHFTLASQHACFIPSSSLSGGSILCIIFFVILAVYLIAGIAFNKYKKGKVGVELVPNASFWRKIPRLSLDGIRFTLNKFQPIEVYKDLDNL